MIRLRSLDFKPFLATIALCLPAACASNTTLSATEISALRAADRHEDEVTRSVRVDARLTVYATLWDAALVDGAAVQQTTENGPVTKVDADTIARWQKEWVDETTAVTVTLEVRNLPSDQLPGKSMQLSPERWSFRLAQAGNAAQTPLKVQMLGLDRFPASGDANHWRVAVQLIFPKQPKGHDTELAIDIPPEPAVPNHLVMPVGVRPVRMRW